MNKQNVLNRLSDVLNVDSINSSQADFLSTHVPFRKITVTNDLSGTPISEHIQKRRSLISILQIRQRMINMS